MIDGLFFKRKEPTAPVPANRLKRFFISITESKFVSWPAVLLLWLEVALTLVSSVQVFCVTLELIIYLCFDSDTI